MPDEELARRAESRVGTTLRDKYHVDRVLGVGGMAAVYAATHRNKKRFAIKMLHPELSLNGDVKKRFLREGYVANTVDHPGAVAVLDDDVADDGAPFIVMELLEGAGVEELWERHGFRMSVELVLGLADQLLAVLDAAHAKEVVHRDLKPANLFLMRDGTLKVLDFGIARLREAVASGPSSATQTGALMGTPAFLPPEQAGGRTKEIDGQTDLWAVGATMFTLLTGEMVHSGENATQLVIAAATKPARPLATVMAAPPSVAALVDTALAFDKAARWPNAAAMRQAVRQAYQGLFGRMPSRESLEALFSSERLPAKAAHTELLAQRASTPASQGTVPLADASGLTTGQPVSSTPSPSSSSQVQPKRNVTAIAVVAGVALVGVVGFGAVARTLGTSKAEAAAHDTATATPPPPPLSVASPTASATPPVATETTRTVTQAVTPSAATTAAGHARAHVSATPSASAAPSGAPKQPVCEAKAYVDANGITQYKKECK